MSHYFGTDGVRGRVGEAPMTVDFALRLASAAAQVLAPEGGRVLIGKDTRVSGYMFESALEAGFVAAGVDVLLMGPLPTPGIAYMTQRLNCSFGVVISASHNRYDDNGIKFFDGNGSKLSDSVERRIEALLDSPVVTRDSKRLGKASRTDRSRNQYQEFCASTIPPVQGIGALIFVLWGARLWLNPKPKLLWPPLAWVVVMFTVYAVARYFTSDIEYVARAEVIQVLLFALVFFVVVNSLHGQDEAQTIKFYVDHAATLLSCYALAQLITHSDRVWNLHSGYIGRAGADVYFAQRPRRVIGNVIAAGVGLPVGGPGRYRHSNFADLRRFGHGGGAERNFFPGRLGGDRSGHLLRARHSTLPSESPFTGVDTPAGTIGRRRSFCLSKYLSKTTGFEQRVAQQPVGVPGGTGLRYTVPALAGGRADVAGSFLVWSGAGAF